MNKEQPTGDRWEIYDPDKNSQHYGRKFIFDFSYIHSTRIKALVKSYIWRKFKTQKATLSFLQRSLEAFQYFIRFAHIQEISSLSSMDHIKAANFKSYLATVPSKRYGKPLAYGYQRKCFDTLKAIIYYGQEEMPTEVPRGEIFTGNEFPGVNQNLKIDFIPDDIVKQIQDRLHHEENLYLQYGVIILQSTGMRIGDLLKLKTHCVGTHPVDGRPTLRYFIHKTRKNKTIAANNALVNAVEGLNRYTHALRTEAPEHLKDFLFIYRVPKGIRSQQITDIGEWRFREWLNEFVSKQKIVGTDGNLYELKPHQFRRTLFTDMLSKGFDLNVISEFAGIDVTNVSRFYADVKDPERAKAHQQVNIIGNPDAIGHDLISEQEDLDWFHANKDKGARMCDGYCSKPIKDDEICDRLANRLKCYTCRRYITTPEFLDFHKEYLKEIESDLENNIFGEHYASHLRPTAEILRHIINELEALV